MTHVAQNILNVFCAFQASGSQTLWAPRKRDLHIGDADVKTRRQLQLSLTLTAGCFHIEPKSITFAVNVKVKVQQRASILTLDVAV